jgi:plasmid stabilization system protein ParE
MAAEWRLLPEARDDLSDAYAWYEKQRPDLGDELFASIEACLERVVQMPTMHEFVHKDYRRALVRRFPYAVYYKSAGEEVVVYAVYHTARRPSRWRKRLP